MKSNQFLTPCSVSIEAFISSQKSGEDKRRQHSLTVRGCPNFLKYPPKVEKNSIVFSLTNIIVGKKPQESDEKIVFTVTDTPTHQQNGKTERKLRIRINN